ERGKGHQLDVEQEEIMGSGTGFHPAKPAFDLEPLEDVRGLDESQVGRDQATGSHHVLSPSSFFARIRRGGNQERGVGDCAHRRLASRWARISSGESLVPAIALRSRIRSITFSTGGRAARRSNSARRYSCIDLLWRAARAASSSLIRSGTSRMVICTLM